MAARRKSSRYTDGTPQPEDFHLLVIRLSALGDVAMTIPVLLALVATYPQLRITCLSREAFAPLFDLVPNTTLYPIEPAGKHKGPYGLYRLFKDLRKMGMDGVADLHGVLRTHILKFFFGFTSVPFAQINKGRRAKRALTRPQNKLFVPLKSTHQRYADVLEELGFPVDLNLVTLVPRQPLSAAAAKFLGKSRGKNIGLAPFAAFPGKMYPLEAMDSVIQMLNDTAEYSLFLFGGGAEETHQLQTMAAPYDRTMCAAGELSFKEQLILISNLDLMISMDSSNGHLAALFDIPIITLWGVTHPYSGFAPFRQNPDHWLMADRNLFPAIPTSVYGNGSPKGYERAISTISPAMVVKKVQEVLGQAS